MCGIIGYTGNGYAPDILISGLKKLEYRGYDSAGVALANNNSTVVCKAKGKVLELEKKLETVNASDCTCGIGHTRWATHGAPSDINSHPHSSGKVTLVHNGIIENYLELKKEYGFITVSDTDTEVAAMLINKFYNADPLEAIFAAAEKMEGAFALGILFEDRPGVIYAIRRQSPLVIGEGEGENFIASDIPAILPYTKKYHICDQDEAAVITKENITFVTKDGIARTKTPLIATFESGDAEKGGYPHYMLKEIHEQPSVVAQTISGCKNGTELFKGIDFNVKGRIIFVACGSATHAALLGKSIIEKVARVAVSVETASEFRYDNPILSQDDLVIAISQSGETADTLAALRLAKEQGVPTLGIVNVAGSTLSREADKVIYTKAGPEICVATTKAYLCQVTVLYLIALKLARTVTGEEKYTEYLNEVEALPTAIETALLLEEHCKKLAMKYFEKDDAFYIGRGADFAVCTEGSLKLKEVSYVHSEAYAAGELKHGTISLVTEGTPVISLMTDKSRLRKTISNVKEVASRGAATICITYDDVDVSDFCNDKITLSSSEFIAPIVANIPLQLFAYYVAVMRGNDVDKPRNLAKSVTVE